jgi:hypothetical protein
MRLAFFAVSLMSSAALGLSAATLWQADRTLTRLEREIREMRAFAAARATMMPAPAPRGAARVRSDARWRATNAHGRFEHFFPRGNDAAH